MFKMEHADLQFEAEFANPTTKDGGYILLIRDTFSQTVGVSKFDTEVEMLAFVGKYLLEADGPTEEFVSRYPMHA